MPEELAAPPVPDGPPAGPSRDDPFGWGARRRLRWPAYLGAAVAMLVLVALFVAPFIHVPYVIVGPGDATPLDQSVVQVHGAKTYGNGGGDLLFLTVTVSNRDPNLYRWLFAKLDHDNDVSKRQTVNGCAGYAETNRLAVDQMDQSQDTAKAVALRKLGYTVDAVTGPVQIVEVVCGGPSEGRLELGDQIVAIDGQPVTTAEDVRPPIVARQPGETAVFTVLRGSERIDVPVKLGKHVVKTSDGQSERMTYAGIFTQQEVEHHLPLTVDIDTQRVSGPSAGLAFTLAIIDQLTPGSLTGHKKVAITGAINDDGTVGPVGGVKQKAITARRAGAKLMLVPSYEYKDARANAGDMKVVSVDTVDDALRALERAGGAPIASTAAAAQ
jgi:PDZ domain-containing protein